MSTPAEFVARAFAVRTAAHLAHLHSRSYAEHVALGDFYDSLVDLVDSYAEAYQGLFGLIEDYPATPAPTDAPLNFLVDFADWLNTHRDKLGTGQTALESILDEAVALTAQTIYKLRFLK